MKIYRSPFFSVMYWVVMVIFLAVIAFAFITLPSNQSSSLCQSDMKWFTLSEIPINIDINDKAQILDITDDNSYSVYFTADKDEENATVSFKTDFSEVQVYINDSLIYTSTDKLNLTNADYEPFSFDAPVSEFHLVNLTKVNSGDKIIFKVKTFYKDTAIGVSNVFYGQSYDIVKTVFGKDIIGMFICIAVFAIGMLMLIFYLSFKKAISLNSLKYAACFAFFASFHTFSEWATISFLFTLGSKAVYMMHIISFMFLLLPIIMFFRESVQHRVSVNCLQVSAVIQSVVVLCATICAAINILDFHKSSDIVELISLAQCIFIFIVIIVDLSKRNEKRAFDVVLPILYIAFIICAVVGQIIYSGNYISIMFILSCFVFMTLVLIVNMHEVANVLKLSNEVEEMGKAAYTDALTGVGNTAAFNKKISHLEVVKVNYKSIAIIQFDVNNLKTINDNLGHEQGDKLIKDGAAIIYKVFGKIGNVYRTGGDEFVGIICGDDAITLCYNAIASFNMAIDEYNSDDSHKFILQIAYGSEYYSGEGDRRYMTLKEIQKQADKNMYKKKQNMKTQITENQILKREPINFDY